MDPTKSTDDWDAIQRIVNRFEDAWRAGRPPAIADYLGDGDLDDREIVAALVPIDMEYRFERGERPGLAVYLADFPGLAERPARLRELSERERELRERFDPGDDPAPAPTPALAGDAAGRPAIRARVQIRVRLRIGAYAIVRELGSGSFGTVYLARDEALGRPVAIKVLRPEVSGDPALMAAFEAEARAAAGLEHEGIVAVYQFGREADGTAYLVMEYVDGPSLAERLAAGRPGPAEAAGIIAAAADAIGHVHNKGLVHGDLKPANLLIDASGRPRIADFGLAIHESEQRRARGRRAGTPQYMSPEQVQNEWHRLDGRSDIWSLGAILYEMLTGRPPFAGETVAELMEEILLRDPRPPRMIDGTIPAELERIALACLEKRPSDRYRTAPDLARDLRAWAAAPASVPHPSPGPAAEVPAAPEAEAATTAAVTPKGLRSFDARDAGAFLELLPGATDRSGLPESVRFWKDWIEAEGPPSSTSFLGLIYGPSGCGKSSLVKAGILPRLGPRVVPAYLVATREGTEDRLLELVRARCPWLPRDLGLVEAMAEVRRRGPGPGRKLLLVLDQFEQWLHSGRTGRGSELLLALRHCDGAALQAIVLVRDDYLMAVSEFMKDLDLPQLEGENMMVVELFTPQHARKVLAKFGRAFGCLPGAGEAPTAEQGRFLDEAAAGLARDGKVIPVRLSLFAEMIKGKPWTPATLRDVGGAEGVGLAFLEETFSSPSAPLAHRLHQKAARAVLKALLPERGSDIKGHMRPRRELMGASGYADRPADFEALLRILDVELRLITPTGPGDGLDAASPSPAPPGPGGEAFYQLTHDYLIGPLREWLTSKQRETLRGRAEIRLDELASVWDARRGRKYLPSWWEWASILALTSRRRWNRAERGVMRAATVTHALRTGAVAAAAAAAFVIAMGLRAATLVEALMASDIREAGRYVRQLDYYRPWSDPILRRALRGPGPSPGAALRASLALVDSDPSQVESLLDRMLTAPPDEFRVIREALAGRRLAPRLWGIWDGSRHDPARALRAACGLAALDPRGDRWAGAGPEVAATLVAQTPYQVPAWSDLLRPAAPSLIGPLSRIARDPDRPDSDRQSAVFASSRFADALGERKADVLVDCLALAAPDLFASLGKALDGDPARDRVVALAADRLAADPEAAVAEELREFPPQPPRQAGGAERARDAVARRRANLAFSLLRQGDAGRVWPLLRHGVDPRLRTYLIHGARPYGVPPGMLARRLREEPDASARRALILALGEYPPEALGDERSRSIEDLTRLYRDDPDPGVHSAAEWTLRRAWDAGRALDAIDAGLATRGPQGGRRWYRDARGSTFALVPGPAVFAMGSPEAEPKHVPAERRHARRIAAPFLMATSEVTVRQYREFTAAALKLPAPRGFGAADGYCRDEDGPPIYVTWYEAAQYCRWLSEREGYRDDECPFPAVDRIGPKMTVPPDYLDRPGYRLPTEAEWEYACRAGTSTSRFYGEDEGLLAKYAWFIANSDDHTHPAGLLKPNDFGLFDILGNTAEWCQGAKDDYPSAAGPAVPDRADTAPVGDDIVRPARGGAFYDQPSLLRAASRYGYRPDADSDAKSFRIVRTFREGIAPRPGNGGSR